MVGIKISVVFVVATIIKGCFLLSRSISGNSLQLQGAIERSAWRFVRPGWGRLSVHYTCDLIGCSYLSAGKRDGSMARVGLSVNAVGLLISITGTVLLFQHTTNKYHSAVRDIGSIAVAYLGVILLEISVSVTGVALLL